MRVSVREMSGDKSSANFSLQNPFNIALHRLSWLQKFVKRILNMVY